MVAKSEWEVASGEWRVESCTGLNKVDFWLVNLI